MPDRNKINVDREADGDEILDAARATVLDFGVRRATLTEVARRAGVSRMTVYRRYEDALTLIRALMTREFGAVVVAASQAADESAADPRERVALAAAGTVERLLEHPLLLRLLELEPEILLPYLTVRRGEFQARGLARLSEGIAAGQAAGVIRTGDPDELADMVERLGRGPVLAARTYDSTSRIRVVAEFRRAVASYLAP